MFLTSLIITLSLLIYLLVSIRSWIETVLAGSTADYLIVAGHFPVYSVCQHGNTQNLVDNLKPLLVRYGVQSYLSGHDHCM